MGKRAGWSRRKCLQTAPLGLGLEGGPNWEMRQPYAVLFPRRGNLNEKNIMSLGKKKEKEKKKRKPRLRER